MNPLETYLRNLDEIRSTGARVSGKRHTTRSSPTCSIPWGLTLKPQVPLHHEPGEPGSCGCRRRGTVHPRPVPEGKNEQPLTGQPPSRGAIECKGTKDDAWRTSETSQISKYWDKYKQVLVDQLPGPRPRRPRPHRRASHPRNIPPRPRGEVAFWQAATHAHATTVGAGRAASRSTSSALCYKLPRSATLKTLRGSSPAMPATPSASLGLSDLPALATTRKCLSRLWASPSRGRQSDPQHGERFFRSTLVQTLFYGVFSAWVLWHRKGAKGGEVFSWETAANFLYVPILRASCSENWPTVSNWKSGTSPR